MPCNLKCNIDDAFFKEENVTSSAMCIRDDQGQFMLARSDWSLPLLLVHEGEASCLF